MSLADYYERAALAAAQVIAGFDEQAFKAAVGETTVGVAIDLDASQESEGQALVDLTVRLLARFYPRMQFEVMDPELRSRLEQLARRINPNIELVNERAAAGVAIGLDAAVFSTTVFAGSDGWIGRTSRSGSLGVGESSNPFGAGAAACCAASQLFRLLFIEKSDESEAETVSFSTWSGELRSKNDGPAMADVAGFHDAVLVGVGAIGQSVAWCLARTPLKGRLHLVDPEHLELSNLQRYVLGTRSDVGKSKVDLASSALRDSSITPISHGSAWGDFVAANGYDWEVVATALDTSVARRSVQGSLPRRLANAWTQPGDLGMSIHGRFGTAAACLACLYQRNEPSPNEDELVAGALGVPSLQPRVRDLLHLNSPLDIEFLNAVSDGLGVDRERVIAFQGRTIRELYVEGLCGGALVGISRVGAPRSELHVPLAHQSALAGVLLGAALIRLNCDQNGDETLVTRIDILRPMGTHLTQSAAASYPTCVCRDADFVEVFDSKWWGGGRRRPSPVRTKVRADNRGKADAKRGKEKASDGVSPEA